MKENGFTLVELITVLILLGILSAVALPRFFDNDSFTSYFDQSEFVNALNWTRNRAITSQCAHEFRIDSSGWRVLRDDDQSPGVTNDCETDVVSSTCTGNEFYSFAYTGSGDIVTDGAGQTLSGDAVTSAIPQRFIFTATGQLFRLSGVASLPANIATGCTELQSSNKVANNTTILLDQLSLTADGETAYVAIQ